MNRKQLQKLGVPPYCVKIAVEAICHAATTEGWGQKENRIKSLVQKVLENPKAYLEDPLWGKLAFELIEEKTFRLRKMISYKTWGDDIDSGAHQQMENACHVPSAVGAALMPDAHLGYGLPIGGVLALENAVIPYAVGVDIACRMKISVLDLPVESMTSRYKRYKKALQVGTRFGVGVGYRPRKNHDVMDQNWRVTQVTQQNKDKAWKQLGTSGSGNHFVEFGVLTLSERDEELGLDPGSYTALLSHSGSRGTGAAVCNKYSRIAQNQLSPRHSQLGRLAWLDLDSEAGQEYWAAMNLMGDYASANHAVIHHEVTKLLGAEVIAGVENHHNFAWKETHGGREVIVHRKGATPAGEGILGVIPGSMADPAFIVRGKGKAASFCSAAHGAGRCMSRRQANNTFCFSQIRKELAAKGIMVLSAGSDEVPGVYKNILDVMKAQQDLVSIVARFDPKIVKMNGDGSRAED